MDRQAILPSIPLPASVVELDGVEIKIKSLSRSQALRISTDFKDRVDDAETFILSCGTGVSLEEAEEWRNAVDAATAGKVVDAIIALSGLMDTNSKN